MERFDEGLSKVLDEAKKMALYGKYGFASAENLAIENLKKSHFSPNRAITRLVKNEIYKCTINGGITSFGGFMTSIAGFPANFLTVLAMQLRIVYAVAYIKNYEIKNNDSLDVLAKVCLISNNINDFLIISNEVGMKNFGKVIPSSTLKSINERILKALTTKFLFKTGGKVLEFVPFIGGIVGGIIDYNLTYNVGNTTKSLFSKNHKELVDYFLK